MLDKISGLFRRSSSDAKHAATVAPGAKAVTPLPVVDPAIEQARQSRVAEASALLDGSPSHTDMLRIARDDLPSEMRLRAIARINDNAALRDIALNDKVARVRLAAAERLTAAEELEALRRDSTDKAVQRHVRETLKTLRDAEKSAQETRARIQHVLTSLAQHAARNFEPLYDAKLESLEAAWQPLAAQAASSEQEKFVELTALARDTVKRHAAEINARQQAIAAKQELISACSELEIVVGQLQHEDLTASLPSVAALQTTQETRWHEAASLTAVDAPLEKRFHAARKTLEAWLTAAAEVPRVAQESSELLTAIATTAEPDSELLDDWQHALDGLQARCTWPDGLLQPALIGELAAARKQIRLLEKARQLDRQQQLAQLRKRRHALKRMIDEGQLRAATRSIAWLRKRIAELPAADAASELTALEPIAEALQALHGWYEFASVPKKTELCERIEALAATTLTTTAANASTDVGERAEKVRELREQWTQLCAADPEADPELRSRFDSAAGIAYAPCAAWYNEQHRIQDENLAKRAALCDELAAFVASLDAQTIDWRAVEKRERDARALWKTIDPVRWPDARATQDRFSSLIGDMRARLDGERQTNAAQREALIAQAVALQQQEPVDAAINAAKRLQDAWKNVGFTDPRDDRRLWQTFRTALDAVFARRDAARNAEREARDAAQAEFVRQRDEQARQQAEEQQRRAAREELLQQARRDELTLAADFGVQESRWLAGESVDLPALAARVDVQIEALPKSALLATLKSRMERMQRGEQPAARELAANGEQLAMLTLDLEIANDIESPAALAAARMQRKVERLNLALRGGKRENGRPDSGKSEKESGDPRIALLNNWLACGPVSASERDALQARIAKLLTR